MELKELQELLETYKGNMKELLTKQAEELKKYGETTASTAKSIEAMDATIKSITEGMEAAKKRMDELEAKAGRIPEPTVNEVKSPGQTFVESEAYKAVMQAFNWDPQPIGKAPLAYQVVSNAYANLVSAGAQ